MTHRRLMELARKQAGCCCTISQIGWALYIGELKRSLKSIRTWVGRIKRAYGTWPKRINYNRLSFGRLSTPATIRETRSSY